MVKRIIRRTVYAVLIAALIFGVVRHDTAPDQHVFIDSLLTLEAAIFLLLLWCAIFIRVEPTLTRVALVIVLLSFFDVFWFRDANTHFSSSGTTLGHLTNR